MSIFSFFRCLGKIVKFKVIICLNLCKNPSLDRQFLYIYLIHESLDLNLCFSLKFALLILLFCKGFPFLFCFR